jgi:hypothetical protein
MQSGPKVDNYFDAKFALLDAYMATSNIYNAYDPRKNKNGLINPIALVTKHPCVSNLDYMWTDTVESFARSGVYELLGVSLTDAFKLPMWKLDQLIKIAIKIRGEKNKTMQKVHNDLQNLSSGKL